MKSTVVRALCSSALFIVGVATAVSAQDRRTCSNASLTGAWGYSETGTVVTPNGSVSAAAVGKYTFDREGTFSGTQHSSVAGTISQDTKLGTYTVNPDCTATLVYLLALQGFEIGYTGTATGFMDGEDIVATFYETVLLCHSSVHEVSARCVAPDHRIGGAQVGSRPPDAARSRVRRARVKATAAGDPDGASGPGIAGRDAGA